ncbi:MAG: ABC transporter substrate-binding protein [Candidatus Entotheonella factor]|uniref:ABC transporter substrate-binding protein n=1 Tax=Entotheonella factor TaxID=1429438 RepID=W4LNX0_ENTF1|nr:MAG: ABC transporter substrate-binding protein [Candidatus Entotheonella factor]
MITSIHMRRLLCLAAVVTLFATVAASADQLAIKFSLDWKFEGPSAAYFVALDKGYYKAEGLDVTIDTGKGSLEAIPRVASGVYQLGFADINSLIKFRDKNPDVDIKGVLMVYDAPPFAIITLGKTGIKAPRDLEGRILGAPAPDGAYAQWKAFVKENGIDASKVKIENVGFPVREPMLVAGEVDAITGYSFSSFLNLKSKGIAPDQIRVLLMSNYGLDLYGNTIIVNPAFAAENPEAVRGFVRATIKGWQDTVADPEAAVKHVLKRNLIARAPVELERLNMCIADNVRTSYVQAHGFGGVDMARLGKSIEQIAVTYTFTNPAPAPEAVFTNDYLPPQAERVLP